MSQDHFCSNFFGMNRKRRNVIAILLIVSILPHSVSSAEKTKKPVVAFVGTKFTNVPEVHHDRINLRFHRLFSEQMGIVYMGPNPVKEVVGKAVADSAIGASNKELLARMARKSGADHLFFAVLDNQSQHEGRVMLVGDVVRYDLETNQFYRMEVLKYLEDFAIEIARVKQHLLENIAQDNSVAFSKALLTMGVIMILGLLMLFVIKTEVNIGGDGTGPTDNTGVPGLNNLSS